MKKTLLLLPIIAFTFLMLLCCKKKKENIGPPPVVWRATINGIPDSGTSISAAYASVSTHLAISLFPTDSASYPDILFTGRSIGNAVIDTGIYNLNGIIPNYFTAEYDSSASIVYYAGDSGGGQLYLTKFDTTAKLISGTFHFAAHNAANPDLDSVVITNGSFTNVSLLIQ